MSYLYLILNLSSLIIPFIFSFHPKIKFYKKWNTLFPAIIITMAFFITWSIIFTKNGIWGFNENYLIGINILSLPIEEWLLFICIPYACVFTHYSLLLFFPNLKLKKKYTTIITHVIIAISILLSFIYYDKWYTLANFIYAIILLILVRALYSKLLRKYYITFLVMLIPFFIINGILTGSFIEHEIVWYNNDENLNFRLITIPFEDLIYAFTLILSNLFIMSLLNKPKKKST